MTIEDAKAQVDAIWEKIDPQTHQFADWLAEALDNPAMPMLMRVAGMARICGTAGVGLIEALDGADGETPIPIELVHKLELLDDIPGMLRAAADLFEAAGKYRPAPQPLFKERPLDG